MIKTFKLTDLDCPVCAGKVQDAVAAIDGVKAAAKYLMSEIKSEGNRIPVT